MSSGVSVCLLVALFSLGTHSAGPSFAAGLSFVLWDS